MKKLIVSHKALPTYREYDTVYIEFNTGPRDMVGNGEGGDIIVQGGVTNGVANVLWHNIIRRDKTKKCQNNVVHTST